MVSITICHPGAVMASPSAKRWEVAVETPDTPFGGMSFWLDSEPDVWSWIRRWMAARGIETAKVYDMKVDGFNEYCFSLKEN